MSKIFTFNFLLCCTVILSCTGLELSKHTPFDHMLTGNYGFSYIISTNPCIQKNEVSITVFHAQNFYLSRQSLTFVKNGSFLVDKQVTMKIAIQDVNDENISHSNGLLINLTESKHSQSQSIQTRFPTFSKHCVFRNKNFTKLWNIGKNSICDAGYRMSEFSTVCVVASSNQTMRGIYMIFVDFCSVPYTFTISTFAESLTHVKRFTSVEGDHIFKLSHVNLECGLHVNVKHVTNNVYDVEMMYTCGTSSHGHLLLNDRYESEYGMMCPNYNCQHKNGSELICVLPWLYNKDSYTPVEVDIKTFDVCKKYEELEVAMSVKDQQKQFFHLVANHDETWQSTLFTQAFNASFMMTNRMQQGNTDFLSFNGGQISFFVKKFTDHYRLVILRHYHKYVFPLLQTDYRKTKANCPDVTASSSSRSKFGLKIGLTVPIILILLIVVVIVIRWRRKKQLLKGGVGLPYQIHLDENDDEAELVDF